MTEMLQMAQRVLNAQPFSKLLNARMTDFSKELSEIRLTVSDSLKQQQGFVHGGVISYLADNALTFAGGAALGSGVVTSEFKINYLRPVLGEEIVARAIAVHAGKSQAVCRCDLFTVDSSGAESLCAVAQGTIVAPAVRTAATAAV